MKDVLFDRVGDYNISQFCTIVLIMMCLNANPLFAADGPLVEIKEVGFEIQKPADWHFFQELNNPLGQDNPTIHTLLSHYAKTPVVAISKFLATYGEDINPNIRVTIKPVTRTSNKQIVESQEPVNLLQGMVTSLKPVLQNLIIDENAKSLKFSGLHAAFARISYTMRLIAGGQTRGNSDLWLVMPKRDYVFLISAVTREEQINASREELKEIVETVKIRTLEH